ncbi:poly-gamma-glutamate hydrolase family protein [Paludifilum halophilum]|uniref:poly-gamma-glutamate hydrolase family protein n=1 Tax=Paludifilum halophilum TaxID=1642702 RepID=UPI00146D67D2|nr:poly-gamma-glutamate hydrolase family protein [Paludifilum halophilum]
MAGKYFNYAELESQEREGKDYRIYARDRGTLILAIHGGGIEPGTQETAIGIAGEEYNLYVFASLKPPGENADLHITSTRFDEPQALHLVSKAVRVVSVHGVSGTEGTCYMGGRDRYLKNRIREKLHKAGFDTREAPDEIGGDDPENICNRGMTGRGVQLELDRALRDSFFEENKREGRKKKTKIYWKFVQAVREALS